MKNPIGIAGPLAIVLAASSAYAAPDRDHLQCFKIKDTVDKAGYTADLTAANPAFAAVSPGCSIKLPAKLLCIDVAKSNVAPAPPGSPGGVPGQEYLCYKSTCDKQAVTVDATDQFGTRTITATSTGLVCAPVDVQAGSTDHTFVLSGIDLPTSSLEAEALGFDLDGVAGDGVDNVFGLYLGTQSALVPGFDAQVAVDAANDQGQVVMLANIRSGSLSTEGVGRFSSYPGSTAVTPAACSGPSDTVCRRHLAGTGSFTIDASASTDPDRKIRGSIMGGTFNGGPGTVTLQMSIFGTPVTLPVQKAEISLAGLSSDGWSGAGSKLGGAISQTDIEASVIPAMTTAVRSAFAADCSVGGTPPSCGCSAGSTGATLRNLYDKAPTQDCVISDPEVSTVVSGFLVPDIDLDSDGAYDAVSIGIGIHAVKGSFPVP